MTHILAITYPEEAMATKAAEEFDRCADDLGIDPDAAAVVVCGHDGSCRLTTSRRLHTTAHWSRFWSGLLGSGAGEEEGTGVDAGFRFGLEARLLPGTSALLAAVSRAVRGRVLDALGPYGGDLLSCEVRDASDASIGEEITRSG